MHDLVAFAARYRLSPHEATTLPAVFENASKKTGIPSASLVAQATWRNEALGAYIASVARDVAQQVDGPFTA